MKIIMIFACLFFVGCFPSTGKTQREMDRSNLAELTVQALNLETLSVDPDTGYFELLGEFWTDEDYLQQGFCHWIKLSDVVECDQATDEQDDEYFSCLKSKEQYVCDSEENIIVRL